MFNVSLYCGYLSPILLEIKFGESGSKFTLLYCSNGEFDLSKLSNALIETVNVEYCSTPSIFPGSFKLEIETLYSWHKCLPWSNVWILNSSFVVLDESKNCEVINGVEAYPYPSVWLISPLNVISADWVTKYIKSALLNPIASVPWVVVSTETIEDVVNPWFIISVATPPDVWVTVIVNPSDAVTAVNSGLLLIAVASAFATSDPVTKCCAPDISAVTRDPVKPAPVGATNPKAPLKAKVNWSPSASVNTNEFPNAAVPCILAVANKLSESSAAKVMVATSWAPPKIFVCLFLKFK